MFFFLFLFFLSFYYCKKTNPLHTVGVKIKKQWCTSHLLLGLQQDDATLCCTYLFLMKGYYIWKDSPPHVNIGSALLSFLLLQGISTEKNQRTQLSELCEHWNISILVGSLFSMFLHKCICVCVVCRWNYAINKHHPRPLSKKKNKHHPWPPTTFIS